MLNRKLWRDLWVNKTQFLSIFLMSFLGLFLFAGMNAEGEGSAQTAKAFYEETNLSDFWIYGRIFTQEDVKEVQSIKGVLQAERRLVTTGKALFPGERSEDDPFLFVNIVEDNTISRVQVVDGEPFDAVKGGIWVDYLFAQKQKISPGDQMSVEVQGMTITTLVRGTVRHPEYVYYLSDEGAIMPEYGEYGFVFMPGKEFPVETEDFYTEIVVDIDENMNPDSIRQAIPKVLDDEDVMVTDRDQNISYSTFDAEVKSHKVMGFLFPIVFLMIAILGIITTMTRMTAKQRTQIGTLKALGFTRRRITRHYTGYGFWISLLGSVSGTIMGIWLIPMLIFPSMQMAYVMPYWKVTIDDTVYLAIAISTAIATLVSYLACRKELADPPAVTLLPKAPKRIKHTALEKSRFWLSLSFDMQWNIRDILRNRARTVMGIVGVAGCTMLMLCAFGMNDSISGIASWMYEELMINTIKVNLDSDITQRDAQEYARELSGQQIGEYQVEFVSDTISKTGLLTVIDDGSYVHMQNERLEEDPIMEDGIALSFKMAQLLGIEKNEFIRWHKVGDTKWQNTRVTQIYRNPTAQGMMMTKTTYETLHYVFKTTSILTNCTPGSDWKDKPGIGAIMNIGDMKADLDETMEIMGLTVGIMVSAAAALGMIVLYNLGVLSFIEKMRETATLKVLGFQSSQIKKILRMQTMIITSIGIIAGLPLGFLFLQGMVSSMPENMDMMMIINFPSYIYATLGTYLVAIFVNLMLSTKVKTIDMVDALKGPE